MNAAHDSSIRPLTSLRFLAALLVFLSHYSGYVYKQAEQPWQAIILEGHAGVTVFFVLSGFLITLHYLPLIQAGQFSFGDYYLRRGARILPLYWFVLVLSSLLASLTPFHLFAPVPLVNWTLTQAYFSHLSTSFIVAAWSLTVEVSFYLIAPIILHFCAVFQDDLRRVFATLAAWVIGLWVLGLILVWIAQSSGLNQPYGFMDSRDFMIHFTIFGRGFNFCWGILLGWLYLKYRDTLWSRANSAFRASVLFLVALVGIGLSQIAMNAAGGGYSGWFFNQAVALFAGFAILSLTNPMSAIARLLSQPLPVYLGHISYALFLLQTTTIARGINFMLLPVLGFFTVPIFYVLMTLCSAILYQYIERPSRSVVLKAGARFTPRLRRART
ncbi:MAG: acyltransferase [Chloroflexota bacterium]